MESINTDGKTIREVTGWTEINFVGDDDLVIVHFGGESKAYAMWTDRWGVAHHLGDLCTNQLVCLGSREQDEV
jgi:hypothetical protein